MLDVRKKQLEEALSEAREIARKKDLSDEERADLLGRVEKIEGLKKEVDEEIRIKSALEDVQSTDPEEVDDVLAEFGRSKSLGRAFIESEQFEEWRAKGFDSRLSAFEYRQKSEGTYRMKSEPTVIDEATALDNLVIPQRVNQFEALPSQPILVPDLIPTIPTNSNAVTYFVETSETSSVAPASEGSEKGNFTLAGEQVTDEVEAIAGMAAVSRQTLEDAAFMAGFVDTRLTRALRNELEKQVLLGDGSPPNLDGFMHRTTATAAVQATETVTDAIYRSSDKCFEEGGYMADSVIITPSDWQPIALSKDQNGRYYGDGPFGSALGPTIWGLKVVKTRQASMRGTVIVGAFNSAAFLAARDGVSIRTSDSHSDYFKKNKIAVLIEQRVALGVPQPLAFCVLSGVTSS